MRTPSSRCSLRMQNIAVVLISCILASSFGTPVLVCTVLLVLAPSTMPPSHSSPMFVQGEMSATVFYYPASWLSIIDTLRSRVLAGKPTSWASNVKVGTSTNFDKLCGCVLQVPAHTHPLGPFHLMGLDAQTCC